jgi:metallophosphoesterase (TIGR03768 family)
VGHNQFQKYDRLAHASGPAWQRAFTRRDFMKYATGTFAGLSLGSLLAGCEGGDTGRTVREWPIADQVSTTAQQQIFPIAVAASTPHINPGEVSLYAPYGYSAWQVGPGLAYETRALTGTTYAAAAPANAARLLSFFSMSDIHLADKESPAQPIYVGLKAGYGSGMSSAYSPVILSTTQVLDAAVRTINALHERMPFDFGISLGDDANNSQYNEVRWFLDVLDGGKIITPSSGGHLGSDSIDYQMPYLAAGLNKAIPWYQVIGNHDQFWMGSSFENAKTTAAHVSDTIINTAYSLNPAADAVDGTGYYMGVVRGSTIYGDIYGAGPEGDFPTPPTIIADPDRRTLSSSASTTQNWMREFFNTTSNPVGHGFTQANLDHDFACYSFLPKSNIPIKVIALDDTAKGAGQPNYAAGYLNTGTGLNAARLQWLKDELQAGQDANQLMIIAAHIPVKPQTDIGNSAPSTNPFPVFLNPVDDALLAVLHTYPNLIMWIAGHRHVNVVTPQPSPDPAHPEFGFWEVETASLRDFPQQFRTFDIRRNTDNTISIIVTNVDPAVVAGSPAAKSRGYAIGAARVYLTYPLTDTRSRAYNAELIKQLTPTMQAVIANAGSPIG